MSEQPMSQRSADPDEQDQHDQPAKKHGDKLEEAVTDHAEMHDEQ